MQVLCREIAVRFEFVGFHQWGAAPERRKYLSGRHRHKFYCVVTVPVTHHDRQIEFHDLLDFATNAVPNPLEGMSCEMIAEAIGQAVAAKYVCRARVEVWEDNECGGIVEVGHN